MISYNHPTLPHDIPNISQPPSASSKTLDWLHGDSRSSKNNNPTNNNETVHETKLIHLWEHNDVGHFMIEATSKLNSSLQDINFAELSGVTGKDLLQMTEDDFKKIYPRNATALYQLFQSRVHQEKAQQAAALAASSSLQDRNRLNLATSPMDFINQSNNFLYPSHHNVSHQHQHQQQLQIHQLRSPLIRDSSRCDVVAPHEIRYEYKTLDPRPIHADEGDSQRFFHDGPPSASRKTFDLQQVPSPVPPSGSMEEDISDPDESSAEEEVKPEPPPKKRGPGRPRKPENELKKKRKKTGRLWEFIRNLLLNPETCPSMVRWENPEEGIFRFVQAEKVAQRWGQRKNNKDMNYEKLSRAMRYYYKGEVFEAVLGRRLVYKFGRKATGWRPSNPNFNNPGPYSTPPTRETSAIHVWEEPQRIENRNANALSSPNSSTETMPTLQVWNDCPRVDS